MTRAKEGREEGRGGGEGRWGQRWEGDDGEKGVGSNQMKGNEAATGVTGGEGLRLPLQLSTRSGPIRVDARRNSLLCTVGGGGLVPG